MYPFRCKSILLRSGFCRIAQCKHGKYCSYCMHPCLLFKIVLLYHSRLPLAIRDASSSCTVDLRIYIPTDSSGNAFSFRNNITIPKLWKIFIFVPLLIFLTSKKKPWPGFSRVKKSRKTLIFHVYNLENNLKD